MRTLIYFLVTLFFLACSYQSVENKSDKDSILRHKILSEKEQTHLISGKKIGNFEIGELLPEVNYYDFQLSDSIDTTEMEKYQKQLYHVYEKNELLMNIRLNKEDLVEEIELFSDKFKTKEGISIGSSLEKFVNVYKDAKIFYCGISNQFVATNDKLFELQYIIDNKDYSGSKNKLINADLVFLKPSDFKKSAKISKIRVN